MVFNKFRSIILLLFLNWLQLISSQTTEWRRHYITEIKCSQVRRSAYDAEKLRKSESSIREIMENAKFTPLLSKLDVFQLSMMSRGEKVMSDGDAQEVCIKISNSCPNTQLRTFGKTIETTCDNSDLQNMKWKTNPDPELQRSITTRTAKRYYLRQMDMTQSVEWTNGKDTILVLRCSKNGLASWFVNSSKERLSPEEKRKVLRKVKQLGFNPRHAVETTFHDNCK